MGVEPSQCVVFEDSVSGFKAARPAGMYSVGVGEVEKEGGTLVIKRVHITYHLKVEAGLLAEKRDAIQRAFDLHPDACPVYRSISGCIDITKDLKIIES